MELSKERKELVKNFFEEKERGYVLVSDEVSQEVFKEMSNWERALFLKELIKYWNVEKDKKVFCESKISDEYPLESSKQFEREEFPNGHWIFKWTNDFTCGGCERTKRLLEKIFLRGHDRLCRNRLSFVSNRPGRDSPYSFFSFSLYELEDYIGESRRKMIFPEDYRTEKLLINFSGPADPEVEMRVAKLALGVNDPEELDYLLEEVDTEEAKKIIRNRLKVIFSILLPDPKEADRKLQELKKKHSDLV